MHAEDLSLPRSSVIRASHSADALLVARIRQGDAEAGRRFVRDHYLSVFRYLLYLTGSREMAEDLTQETFVQAWRGLDALDEQVRLRPWLHRIAHREFLQALRSRRPQVSLDQIAELSEPGAGERAEAAELRVVLQQLPLAEREMVVLHYLEGYNCEEIAGIVGVPTGTVKYRLSEARARLRRELDEPPSEGWGREP